MTENEAAASTAENGDTSPSREDYLRATAEALGLGPDEAVAHLDQTLAHNRESWRRVEAVRRGPARGCPRVEGVCPTCGARSLFLGSGGYVTCASLNCSNPCSPSEALGVVFPPGQAGGDS